MQWALDVLLMFLSVFGDPQDQETSISSVCQSETLVHPFLRELQQRTLKRYEVWDQEDIEAYMRNVHEHVHVSVYVKDQVSIILS